MAVWVSDDKLTDLASAAALVSDGDVVAIGGGLSNREPMALVRELIRQRRRRLHLVGSAHGVDVDMLVAAGVVGIVEESYVGFEQDFGLAPAFRRAAQSGAIEVRETCCYTVLQQLRAAEFGLPFLPVRGVADTDIGTLHPEYGEVKNPFGDDWLIAVPALAPDVALIHATRADRRGNAAIPRPMVLDERFAHASRSVVVTAEQIVEGTLPADEIVIPYFLVTAVVESPHGAHPTSCYPNYTYDRRRLGDWVEAAATEAAASEYLRSHLGGSERDYLAAIGPDRLQELTGWQDGPSRWQELMA